jgi:hypothetical protein
MKKTQNAPAHRIFGTQIAYRIYGNAIRASTITTQKNGQACAQCRKDGMTNLLGHQTVIVPLVVAEVWGYLDG